jgi:hypothetical protein
MEFQIYKAQIDPALNSDLEVNFIGLVDRPAIERNFQAFNNSFKVGDKVKVIPGMEHMPSHKGIQMSIAEISGNAYAVKLPDGSIHKWYLGTELEKDGQKFKAAFILNDDKMIISGPAMIADMPLYRKDDQLGEYYVIFDKQTIQCIVEKFSAKGFMKNFNLFHDDAQQVGDVTIFNSFVSNAELGVPALRGFEDTADGSWFISAKVNNPDVWKRVKDGQIKGFSVEGLFNYVPVTTVKLSMEEAVKKIEMILSQVEPD